MYYINQLDYPHIRYEHDLDNGGAPEEKFVSDLSQSEALPGNVWQCLLSLGCLFRT